MRAYSILGGVPAYLRQFDDRLSLLDNVEQKVLAMGEFLYDEPRFLLLQELREPSRYFAVLEAIAGGRTRMNEIAQAAHIWGLFNKRVTSSTLYIFLLDCATPFGVYLWHYSDIRVSGCCP